MTAPGNPWDAVTIGGVPSRMIHVACSTCPRRGRYRRDDLIQRYGGDTRLDVLLGQIAAPCTIELGCGAHYVHVPPWDPNAPTMTVARLTRELRRHDESLPVLVTGRPLGHVRTVRVACVGERPHRRIYAYGRPYLLIAADD